MRKIYSLLLFSLLLFTSQVYGQVAGSFDIISMQWRWGSTTVDYLNNNGFITGAKIMSHSTIYGSGDDSRANLESVRSWLIDEYPSSTSTGYLILNWETGPFLDMKNNSKTSSVFKAAEYEILRLMNEVKRVRPNVKISMYRMPFRFWTQSQNEDYNGDGKFDNLFSKVDFIAPSLYVLKADEEVGHTRNLQYIRENLNVALAYGKKFNKPVIPFVWHRVHPTADKYAFEIIQKEVLAKYIKYIYTYSYNNYKSEGAFWWDGLGSQLTNLSGINNCLNGTVYNKTTYDAMIVNYAKHVKQVLGGTTTTTTTTTTTSTGQQLASFTLINADTDQPIQTITNGATLNLATLPTKNLNVRANTSPSTVGSVKFVLSGTQSRTHTESGAPYALFGGSGSNYYNWVPATGSYTLKATPYSASGASGTAGTALTITFSVANQTTSNQAPVANAGASKTITLPTSSVSLSGSGTDADGTISSYAWAQVSGPNTATFSSKTVASPTVSALVAGSYVFSLKVKDNDGAISNADQVTVTVNEAATTTQKVVSFTLVNADTDKDIQTITNGATLNLAALPTKNLNIRVNTNPTTVGSVYIVLSGAQSKTQTETTAPYVLFGNSGSNYYNWVPATGSYTLKATPYSGASRSGTIGTSLTINFTVENRAVENQTMASAMFIPESEFASDSVSYSDSASEPETEPDPKFATGSESDPDSDGSSTHTPKGNSKGSESISVFPNPATEILHIRANEIEIGAEVVIISVYDLAGVAVLTQEVETNAGKLNTVLEIGTLEKGQYILTLNSSEGLLTRQHIVVN